MSRVQPLHLSPEFGEPKDSDRLGRELLESEERVTGLLRSLREAREALDRIPTTDLARSLGAVGVRLLDPADALRREAVARLPRETGLSTRVCDAIVEGMARDWTPDRLGRLLASEFRDPGVLDGFREGPEGSRLHAFGGRLAFHIGSGNVPGVGTTSAIRSLLVKCPVFLKPARTDRVLAELFARGLAEADAELARALAIVYWPGGEGGRLEERLLTEADRVVVYGGTATIEALRGQMPVTTPLVAYHHRISLGAVSRESLASTGPADAVAAHAARAVATFDQRGCVSPQAIWVEQGGAISPAGWAARLARQLELLEQVLPSAELTDGAAATLRQIEGSVELRQAAGGEDRLFTGSEGRWAVIFDPDPEALWSGVGRSVHVKPLDTLDRLPTILGTYREVLQTLALAAPEDRREPLARSLVESGVTRITDFEAQPWPPAWWHHDGQGPLRALVRWGELEPTRGEPG